MSAPTARLTAHGCRHRLLAGDEGASVVHCSCGRVYLTLGEVTVRLDAQRLAELRGTLGRAVTALEREVRPRRLC
jgi:hypothetical protein